MLLSTHSSGIYWVHYGPGTSLVLKKEKLTEGTKFPVLMKIIFWLEIQTLNNIARKCKFLVITRKVIASLNIINTEGEKARKDIYTYHREGKDNLREKELWLKIWTKGGSVMEIVDGRIKSMHFTTIYHFTYFVKFVFLKLIITAI